MRGMHKRFRFGFYFLLFALIPPSSLAQAPTGEGIQKFAEFGDFRLHDGEVIHDFRIGYRTLGKLNDDKSNGVLWPTWIGGKSEDLLPFIGPGNVVDTNKYFV